VSESRMSQTLYFETPGPKNTEALLKHARARAAELGPKKVLIATSTGRTVEEALKVFDPREFTLIAVTSAFGFFKPNESRFSQETGQRLTEQGVRVVTTTHAFSGAARGLAGKHGGTYPAEVMADTLRMFGQGVKVAVEVALMAADAGLVRSDEDVLAIAGTGGGADTALVVQPANTNRCLELKVREVIAKPC